MRLTGALQAAWGALREAGRNGVYRARKAILVDETPPTVPTAEALFETNQRDPFSQWTYFDERWVRIRHRKEHRRLLGLGCGLRIAEEQFALGQDIHCADDGTIVVRREALTADEWFYIYLDPTRYMWRDFRWTFSLRLGSRFKELQLGVRYQDFYNRYRFRFEAGHVTFDKVDNGRFYNNYEKAEYSLKVNEWHTLTVEARGRRFCLSVDQEVVISAYDFDDSFPQGTVCLIFWENDGRTPIHASIRSLRVDSLR